MKEFSINYSYASCRIFIHRKQYNYSKIILYYALQSRRYYVKAIWYLINRVSQQSCMLLDQLISLLLFIMLLLFCVFLLTTTFISLAPIPKSGGFEPYIWHSFGLLWFSQSAAAAKCAYLKVWSCIRLTVYLMWRFQHLTVTQSD